MTSEKTKAAPGQGKAAFENTQQRNHTAIDAARNTLEVLNSKSTAVEVQLAKTMALLRNGPKTTIELRDHGIMMPAARIHHLRHVNGYEITKELVTLYDSNGFCHSKCARYHLRAEVGAKEAV